MDAFPFAAGSSGGKLEPEFADAFNTWKASPTPASRSGLLTTVTPVIDTALRSYGTASPTLRGSAKRLALQAFNTYDPNKGSLKTHLLSQLQGLRRLAAKENNIISLPEQVGLDQKHLLDVEAQLRDENGRDPSDWEIADKTGLSLKRLAYIRKIRPTVAEGMANGPTGDDEDYSEPASQLPGRDDAAEAWLGFVYSDLGPTDRVIMDYSLGRNGTPKLSLNEIARRLGITASAASQRAAKIQKLIDERQSLSII